MKLFSRSLRICAVSDSPLLASMGNAVLHIARLFVAALAGLAGVQLSLAEDRVRRDLLVLYDFDETSGEIVHDRSQREPLLDLHIQNADAAKWESGSLVITSSTAIQSKGPATKINTALKKWGTLTVEVWLTPENTTQAGPARIVTISKNPSERNLTLGQEKNRFDARLRTTGTTTNGMPSLSSPENTAAADKTHVVYTRDRSGRVKIYVNGKQVAEERLAGSPSNWDDGYELALGNEATGDRPWRGALHLVAVYPRALSPAEVARNFAAGADAPSAPLELADAGSSPAGTTFETKIAPIVARHCLECHDSLTHRGGLDLSRKAPALKGGDSGPAVIAGKSAESSLWTLVEANDMPKDRTPLTDDEKQIIKEWIDGGAAWSLDVIDPAVYVHAVGPEMNQVRRLTVPEYIATVRAITGVDIGKEARELLPPDVRTDGFSNTGYNLNVDLKHVEAYAQLAEIIVSRMDVPKFYDRFAKSRSLSTDDTMRDFVAVMGKWILRGPLDEREVTSFSGVATTVASAGGDFDEAASFLIEAMLQSPRFIYHLEDQRGDGTDWPVREYELASRLSYILWGAPPDEDLRVAAEAGALSTPEVYEAQIDRMLADPRAIEQSSRFLEEWMNLGRVKNLRPNTEKFPNWNDQLAVDMRDETLAFFRHVVWEEKRPLADLLNAQVTFATPQLAKHYGLRTPVGEPLDDRGLRRYDLNDIPSRGGLLTQGSVLTVGGDEASMVSRGLFVFHDLLRGTVKSPPPCVDTTPVPAKPGLTQRGIAEVRIANANCAGCHAKFEPLAFGLEKFDGIGAFHEKDEFGNPLRDDGEIRIPGEVDVAPYESSAELMDLLAESDRVRQSITWKWTQFAIGRPLGAGDVRIVEEIHQSAQENGGTYAALIKAILHSDLVQLKSTEDLP